jgi:glycosyltransferase involved in cell wall biosynthesis
LADRFEIELVAVSKTPEEDVANVARMEGIADVSIFPAEPPGPEGSTLHPPQVLRHRSPQATAVVAHLLARGQFDAVHVEGFYLVPLLPATTSVPVVLGEQNVEHRVWALRAEVARDPVERKTLKAQARATARVERETWRRVDRCVTVTEEDREVLRLEAPGIEVTCIPDGADHATDLSDGSPAGLHVLTANDEPTLVSVGNFAYPPSADAARHLVAEVLPRIWTSRPDMRAYLVGNAPPADLVEAASREARLVVTGRVAAIEPFLEAADVVMCPPRYGGGVKVKVLEALHHGCAVVATPLALQGLGEAESCVRIGHSAAELATQVCRLFEDSHRGGAPATHGQRIRRQIAFMVAGLRCSRGLLDPGDSSRGRFT